VIAKKKLESCTFICHLFGVNLFATMVVKNYKLIAINIASISIDAHKVNFGNSDAKQGHYYAENGC